MYQEEGHRKASTTAKTALGLGIGALGVELLGGLGGFLRGNPAMVCNNDAAIYEAEIREISRLNDARQVLNRELFGVYKSQIDADFGLYKNQRDSKDELMCKINEVDKKVDMMAAVRPYQDALIDCKINTNAMIAQYNLEKADCRNIKGVLCLPATPTVTGQISYPYGICPSLSASSTTTTP